MGQNHGVQRMGSGGRVSLPLLAAGSILVVAAGLGFAIVSAPESTSSGTAAPVHVHSATSGDGTAGDGHTDHSHLGPALEIRITDPATRRKLDTQLGEARAAVKDIHTAADAMALGYVRVTLDLAYLGVHYMNPAYVGQPFKAAHPTHLIFGTDAPDAPLIGLMYYVHRDGGPPAGFAGPNDLWHRHLTACMSDGFMLALDDVTSDQCAGLGGSLTLLPPEYKSRWMVHVWVVPGQKNPWGTFANGDPVLA
jgi:hypothetical protein